MKKGKCFPFAGAIFSLFSIMWLRPDSKRENDYGSLNTLNIELGNKTCKRRKLERRSLLDACDSLECGDQKKRP